MNFSVTKNGKLLDPSLYTWDEKTKTFLTIECGLVLDFNNMNNITFNTGSSCTFNTGWNCTFKTGSNCTFKTSSSCTFSTGPHCTFRTNSHCAFSTGSDCTFNTGSDCTFSTGSSCTFKTGSSCTFSTSSRCVIIRRDVFEVIQPEPNVEITLNKFNIKGFEVVNRTHDIVIDGKTVTLSEESFKSLKDQLIGE